MTINRLTGWISNAAFAAILLAGASFTYAQGPEGASNMPEQVPETAEEAAAKAMVIDWMVKVFNEGKAQEAFEMYTSKDFEEHSRRLRGGYDETLAVLSKMPKRDINPKVWVNDEIVLVISEIGNEVFRVQNGKITDHWDLN